MSEELSPLQQALSEHLDTAPELLAFFQQHALDGLWCWDLHSRDRTWIGPRFWAVLGYPPEQMPHRTTAWTARLDPESRQDVLDALAGLADTPSPPFDRVLQYRSREGRPVWLRCRAAVLRDRHGRPGRVLAAHVNVTAQRAAERALAQRHRDMEALAAIVSHDLRAPLRQISALTAALREDLSTLDVMQGPVRELADLIVSRASRAVQLHEDLLSFATAGAVPIHSEEVDLQAAVAAAWQHHAQPGFSLATPGGLPRVHLPRAPVQAVLRNLIHNAIRHHDRPGGTITITAALTDERLCLAVADDGPGIPPQHRQRVFGMFWTAQSRDDGGGTGVGLALVQKLTERFGDGTVISAASPRGSCFSTYWRVTA